MESGAVDIADPYNPAGGRGVGEPSQGSAVAAVTSAIADALGHSFNRVPITPDMIVNFANNDEQSSSPLAINTF